MKRIIPTLALPLVLAAGAFAQTNYSTFNNVQDWPGVHFTTNDGGFTYVATLDVGATVLGWDNVTYNITDIIGVFLLADGQAIASTPNGTPQNGWNYVLDNSQASNPIYGGVTGFKDPNSGSGTITQGNSLTFTFTGAPTPVSQVGFHLRSDNQNFLGTGGPTANVKISAVPEPASMAALAIGGIGLLARRRRKA